MVLGWDRCSLYIKGTGIVYWPPPNGRMEPTEDTLLIESTIIPGTGHIHNSDERTSGSDLASQIGEVTNHIVLEGYIVFTTRLNKVFAWNTSTEVEVSQLRPFELTTFYPSNPAITFHIRDIQGSFRSFAVFTTSGAVLTAYRPLLDAFFHASMAEPSSSNPLPRPSRIASLQNQSVISLAFGDYHVHALHDDGTISSFGRDPQNLGAFGLGSAIFAMYRGIMFEMRSWDGALDGRKRRTIWFEPLMETRMEYLFKPDQEGEVAREEDSRRRVLNDNQSRDKYGDYFEAEGRRWEEGVTDEGEMGAYFALKVAAAGWHSAALVLVDEEKAERARQNHIAPSLVRPVRSTVKVDEGLWSSLSSTVVWSLEPLYLFGRWLMGFFVVHSRSKNDDDRTSGERERKEAERVRYVWENQPLPRLWEMDGWSGSGVQ
jgi:SCF-associated factor 1